MLVAALLGIEKNCEAGDDPGRSIEIAALRHAVEMRTRGDSGERRILARQPDNEIAGGVLCGLQAGIMRVAFDQRAGRCFAGAVCFPGHAEAV